MKWERFLPFLFSLFMSFLDLYYLEELTQNGATLIISSLHVYATHCTASKQFVIADGMLGSGKQL